MNNMSAPAPNSRHRVESKPSLQCWLAVSLLLFLWVSPVSVLGQTPVIETDKTTYDPAEAIVVSFQGGPGNAKDWVGIYPEGIVPGDADSTLWAYVDGTGDGTVGVADGSITFAEGLGAAGTWVAYLLEDDGYGVLASVTFQVQSAGPMPKVASNHTEYVPDEDIVIAFSGGPGNSKDWIGIYPEDVVPGSQASTLWFYVDNTQDGTVGYREGVVTFAGGLTGVGNWKAYLLLDDGYTVLAETSFTVVDPFIAVLVRTDAQVYAPGQPITVTFSNGYGYAKDWIGIYRAGETPGQVDSVLWSYVDGTQEGNTGVIDGSVEFSDGLMEVGDYVAYFLLNDSYTVDGREAFSVVEASSNPRLLFVEPSDGSANNPPVVEFSATLTNGVFSVDLATVQLTLDGAMVESTHRAESGAVVVTYTNAMLFAAGSVHTFELSYQDDAVPAGQYVHTVEFEVGQYRNLILPSPIYFEDFDNVPEGQLPAGWTEVSYTEIVNPQEDLGNLDSLSYATWTVVEADRFAGPLVGYSDGVEMTDYQRVLSVNPLNVVEGRVLREPLASGRFVFGNSGYRQGLSQVLYLYTPNYDLRGHSDVHVVYYSLWEQNQDSLGAVEFSIDGGQSWLPVVYMLDEPDIVLDENLNVDAVATFTQEHDDVATYFDPDLQWVIGGTYETFIASAVSQDLAPFISPRVDDNSVESKRIEVFRLPQADDQAQVQFRFAHAGTDSWYFGIDNFGLYSIAPVTEPPPLTIVQDAQGITISWPEEAGAFVLESKSDLDEPTWQPVDVGGGNSYTVDPSGAAAFYRLRQ